MGAAGTGGLLEAGATAESREWDCHDGGPPWESRGRSEVTRLRKRAVQTRRPGRCWKKRARTSMCRPWEERGHVALSWKCPGRRLEEGHAAP